MQTMSIVQSDNAKYAHNANCAHNAISYSHAMPNMHAMPIMRSDQTMHVHAMPFVLDNAKYAHNADCAAYLALYCCIFGIVWVHNWHYVSLQYGWSLMRR